MSPGTRRYLALGDSYTIGEGVAAADRWPDRLVAGLRAAGLDFAAPRYIATTGWSSDELAEAIRREAPGPHDLVSLLIGVNDQYRGRPAAERREEISDLLRQAVALAGGPMRVLAVSIPDWSVTPFARSDSRSADRIAADIDAYNAMTAALAAEAGVAWIDITPCSRSHPDELAEDGLHPGAGQYRRWSALILPVALARLTAPPAPG